MSIFTNYYIQVDCLLTWFPVKNNAALNGPKIRMDTFKYYADDPPFAAGNKAGRFHGQGLGGIDDGLDSRNLVRAITTTGVNGDQVFFMEFEAGLGSTIRKQQLIFQPNTITPFLINIRAAQGEDRELRDTALAFQGVVTAGPRRSQLIYQVMRFVSLLRPEKP